MVRRWMIPVVALAVLAALSSCRTYEKAVTAESVKITKLTLLSSEIGFDEAEHSYADGKKTVILKIMKNSTYSAEGFKVYTNKTRFISWDPLTKLAEIPQGMVEIIFLPVTVAFNLCTGIYMTDYEENTPWRKTFLPLLYKICPITNDRKTIIGRRSFSEEIISTEEKPAPPWEETRPEPLSAKFISAAPAPGNKKKIAVCGAQQEPDGTVVFSFSVDEDMNKPFITDAAFVITLEIGGEKKDIPFTTKFDNIRQEY